MFGFTLARLFTLTLVAAFVAQVSATPRPNDLQEKRQGTPFPVRNSLMLTALLVESIISQVTSGVASIATNDGLTNLCDLCANSDAAQCQGYSAQQLHSLVALVLESLNMQRVRILKCYPHCKTF